MQLRQAFVGLVVMTFLLAGCVADSEGASASVAPTTAAPPEANAASFDDDTGAIQGTVINDEGLPIAGAMIGLLETGEQTTSAQTGEFTFSNLVPGDYTVSAAVLGYEAASKQVTVVAGSVAQANFQLTPVAIDAPYYVSVQESGNIQCSISWNPGTPIWLPDPSQPTNTSRGLLAPAWYNGLQVCGAASIPTLTPTKFILNWDVPAGATELLAEMVWQSTQALGAGLSFTWEHPSGVNDGTPVYGTIGGFSPLRLHANESKILEVNLAHEDDPREDDFVTQTRSFSTANTTEIYLPVPIPQIGPFPPPNAQKADAGFAFDQRFDIWQTTFMDQVMPEGFSALVDA